jgi:hypothetical protein
MKKIVLTTFLFISVLANAQSNYQRKLFQTPVAGSVTDVVYSNEYNTTTYVVENLAGSSPYTGFATITKFTTTTGNVTSSRSFSIAGYDLAIKQVIKKNHIIFMVASLTNSAGVTGMIIKYNLSTNATSWRRTVAVNTSPYSLNAITYDNGLYLYVLGAYNNTNVASDLFVSKVDTNGTLIWIKRLGEGTLQHVPANILYKGKRELYVTSTGTLTTNSYAITLRLDSSGTILNSNTLFTNTSTGFRAKHSAILKGKLTTIDQTKDMITGDPGAFLVRKLDTNLTSIITRTLTGVNIKQVYANNANFLITGLAPTNLGLYGFRTIRLDTSLVINGSRYFKKVSATNNNSSSASCFINSTDNSFHFFKPNGKDTVTYARADFFEGVGCRDTAYLPTTPTLTYAVQPYTYTVTSITATLTTITLPVATETYSSSSLCTALTTGLNSISNNDEFISVYPNPAKEMLNVKLEMINGEEKHIKVLNSLGQILIDQKSSDDNLKFDINNFTTGIYFISLYNTNDQLIYIKKFIKE